jgi:hypothetical protein
MDEEETTNALGMINLRLRVSMPYQEEVVEDIYYRIRD